MDAISVSASGFDAALKALEDLETESAYESSASPSLTAGAAVISPAGSLALSEMEEPVEDAPAPIGISPLAEIETLVPELADLAALAPPAALPTAAVQPLPAPAETKPSRFASQGDRLGKLAVGLALLSSIISAAGLIVAERTIVSAQLVVADARERQHQLEQSNLLIRQLEGLRDKQVELLQQQQAQLANAPVSSAELQHRLEALQAGLVQHDPMSRVVDVVRAAQADDNARFNEFGMKMARVEAALERR